MNHFDFTSDFAVDYHPFVKRWFDIYNARLTVRLLEKLGSLKHLRLLLPANVELEVGCPVNGAKFKDITVTFSTFSLPPGGSSIVRLWTLSRADRGASSEKRKSSAQIIVEGANKKNWRWEDVEIDEEGFYRSIEEWTPAEEWDEVGKE
jgi:hypothetical protein